MAVAFSNTGQYYVRTLTLGAQSAVTLAGWVYLEASRAQFSGAFVAGAGTTDRAFLGTDATGTDLIYQESNGGTATTGITLTAGTWYFVAAAKNGANVTVYVRSASASSWTTQSSAAMAASVTLTTVTVGEYGFELSADTLYWWNGRLSGFRLWTAALSQADLEAEMWRQVPSRTAGLQVWYPLLKPEQVDYSGNGNTPSGGSGAVTADGPGVPWRSALQTVYVDAAVGSGIVVAETAGRSYRPHPTVPVPVSGWWQANLTQVPFGSGGVSRDDATATTLQLREQWDYWDQPGVSVVRWRDEGLPSPPWKGDRVCKWYKPYGDANVYKKLNRTMVTANWPSGRPSLVQDPWPGTDTSPADVSGRYIVYQYIPSNRLVLNPSHGWVLLSEFKENFTDAQNVFQQWSTWGILANNYAFSGQTRFVFGNHSSPSFLLSDYTDRWVKWEYRLYQGATDTVSGRGGRCELWADDVLLDTGYHDQLPVGSAAFAPLNKTLGFLWVAGNYTSDQTTNGVLDSLNTTSTVYVGLSMILPLP